MLFYERIKPRKGKHWMHNRTLQYTACLAAGLLIFLSCPSSISDLEGLIGDKKAYAASIDIKSKSIVKAGINNDHEVINQLGEFMEKDLSVAKQTGSLGPCDKVINSVDPPNDSEKVNTIPYLKENNILGFTVTVPDVVEKIPVDATPIVAKVLPNYSEEQVAQLIQQNVSTPKIEITITVHKTGTSTTSNTTTQNATSKDVNPLRSTSKSETTSGNMQKQPGSPSKQPKKQESQQKIMEFPPVRSGDSLLHL